MTGGATVLRLPVRYQGQPVPTRDQTAPAGRHGRPGSAARGTAAGRPRLTHRGWVVLVVLGLTLATGLLLLGVWLGTHLDGG